jgi:hypothetical protein
MIMALALTFYKHWLPWWYWDINISAWFSSLDYGCWFDEGFFWNKRQINANLTNLKSYSTAFIHVHDICLANTSRRWLWSSYGASSSGGGRKYPPPPLWMINQEGQHCPLLIEIARLSSLLIYFSHSLVVFWWCSSSC